jgi:hypothetical protein
MTEPTALFRATTFAFLQFTRLIHLIWEGGLVAAFSIYTVCHGVSCTRVYAGAALYTLDIERWTRYVRRPPAFIQHYYREGAPGTRGKERQRLSIGGMYRPPPSYCYREGA